MRHQLSYSIVVASTGDAEGFGDVLLNYRYQLREETAGGPAISPRLSGSADRTCIGRLGTITGARQSPVSKQFGDFYVHANLGYTWLPDLQRIPRVAGMASARRRQPAVRGFACRRIGDGIALPARLEFRREATG
jgi:hypothetical protein